MRGVYFGVFGEASVKPEGGEVSYDNGWRSFPQAARWYVRFGRWLSSWAWKEDVNALVVLVNSLACERTDAVNVATLRKLQLGLLEELFREKQAKISRLQACYNDRKRPLYEDLRKENPIKDAESTIHSLSAMVHRVEQYRARTGKPMRYSDGTVYGVPGDQANVETGAGW